MPYRRRYGGRKRRRTGYRRRSRTYGRRNTTVKRRVRRVEKSVKRIRSFIETKHVDFYYPSSTFIATNPADSACVISWPVRAGAYLSGDWIPGPLDGNYIGTKVFLHKWRIQLMFDSNSRYAEYIDQPDDPTVSIQYSDPAPTSVINNHIRILVVKWARWNNKAYTSSEVQLDKVLDLQTSYDSTSAMLSPYNWLNRKQFRVLYDKVFMLKTDNGRSLRYIWRKTFKINRNQHYDRTASFDDVGNIIRDWNILAYVFTDAPDGITDQGAKLNTIMCRTTYSDA